MPSKQKRSESQSANRHWNSVRKVTTSIDGSKVSEKHHHKTIKHGIYETTRLDTESSIESVTHNLFSGQYIILYEEGRIEAFLKDGSKDVVYLKEPIGGLVFASKPKLYLAWQNDKIKLMKSNFKEINSVPSSGNVNCMLYNEFTNEIISGGTGSVTVWYFRLNNTLIVPKMMINENLAPNDEIKSMTLEHTSSKSQRLFVAVKNGVMVFCLKEGHCVIHMNDLHRRDITDLLFYQPFKVLTTCAKDGSIKVWDESWNLKSVFIGHTSAVTSLSAYQKSPLVVSGSHDGTMRLWNVDTTEEVDCIDTGQPVKGMCRKFGETSFFSFTDHSLTFWKINTVYSIFTVIGSKAKFLKSTTNPSIPMLSYCICEDACIRITCPKDGNAVTVMMSPEWKRILDAVYGIAEDLLFVLLRDGSILRCCTSTNPCTIKETWTQESIGAASNCTVLCLFENSIEHDLTGDPWRDLVTQQVYKKANDDMATSGEDLTKAPKDRVLLFGGFQDGTLSVIKWRGTKNRGKVTFSLEAHRGAIVALACSAVLSQLASCSTDNAVRIWRVFPFAEDALAPLMFILNTEPATHLVFSRHRLCVAFQDASTATYNITMFKTTESEPERIEHGADDDHVDIITSVCSCPKQNLFASASVDGTIKIWDEYNNAIRMIQLNSRPNSMCFCTQRGDLLVGIGDHVHRIPHRRYLPEVYARRMIAMYFMDPPGVHSIEVDDAVYKQLSDDQRHRLQKARSSAFIVAKFVDTIPVQELEERMEEEHKKDMGMSILKKRDDDLEKIRDGELEAKKRSPAAESVREEAWKKYLGIFYKNPVLPPIRDDADSDSEEIYTPTEERDHYTPERGNTGFFSISAKHSDLKRLAMNVDKIKHELEDKKAREKRSASLLSDLSSVRKETARPLSVGLRPEFHTDAPYSRLRRVFSAPGRPELPKIKRDEANDLGNDEETVDNATPVVRVIDVPAAEDFPSSVQTLRNLNKQITDDADTKEKSTNAVRKYQTVLPVAPDGYLPNSVVVALYKELKREETVEDDWRPRELTQEQLDELEEYNRRKRRRQPIEETESLVYEEPKPVEKTRSKLFEKLQDISSSPSLERELDLATPPPTPPKSPTPEPTPEPPIEKPRDVKPVKSIEKLITRPVVIRTPTPPREPTPPPRPQTPLPSFILQFKGQKWFDKCFPNATPGLFPKPWTVIGFLQLMLEFLQKEQDYEIKTQICAAIIMLQRQNPFDADTIANIQNIILVQLNLPFDPKAEDVENQRQYAKTCLTLLNALGPANSQFIVELMAQYITADIGIRHHAIHILHEIGLQDPHNYFTKELDTFSTYGVFDKARIKSSMKDQCRTWLQNWMDIFRKHISSLVGKIYRAKKGNVVRGTKHPKTDVKSILKKEEQNMERSLDSRDKKISFMPTDFVSDAAKNATEIDAINYFCEMEYEKELERARNASVAPSEETVKSERLRNTVLILPKIDGYRSLARLGETHKSCCHPERETSLAYDLRLPPINHSKQDNLARGLIMHLSTLTLNPFPNVLDELLYEPFANSKLLTLKTAPKFFVPSQSYVDSFQM